MKIWKRVKENGAIIKPYSSVTINRGKNGKS